MPFDLIPRGLFSQATRLPSIFEDDELWSLPSPATSGLSISEDQNSVFIEAHLPGLQMENIEVTIDKGYLWIRGEKQESEEDKQKKFYRKASSSFSYHVAVPSNVDETQDPVAVYKNGVMKVTFKKHLKAEPKKLDIKTE